MREGKDARAPRRVRGSFYVLLPREKKNGFSCVQLIILKSKANDHKMTKTLKMQQNGASCNTLRAEW